MKRWPRVSRGGLLSGLAGAALGIAAVTVMSRVVGFGRTLVFARTVGATCLGDTYVTANTVPNILFEVVAGGALASLAVPVLAGPASRGDRAQAARTASALLTWTLVALVPITLAGLLFAHPLMELLIGTPRSGCSREAEIETGTRMLRIFLPQVLGYGICVVLTGVLQAHRRFLGPAVAPLLSSLIVVGAYLTYGSLGQGTDLASVSRTAELTLSVGTTAGVAVLALAVVVPAWRLRLGLRPTFSFPGTVGPRVARLAVAGVATLVLQQLSVAVVLRLANGAAGGSLVLYNLAWTVFLVPWSVVAVPLAISAFPELAASSDAGDERRYAATLAQVTRVLLLVTLGAAVALAVVASPVARVLALRVPGNADTVALAWALAAFAPGLLGYALVAHLGRALYARSSWLYPATAIGVGWLAVIGADLSLVHAFAPRWRVVAFGLGNTIGMTVAGALLLVGVARATRGAALVGVGRAAAAGIPGALAGLTAGLAVVAALGPRGIGASVGIMVLAAATAILVGAAITWAPAPGDLRAQLKGMVAKVRRRSVADPGREAARA